MVFGAVFCFSKFFGEILQKIGEMSSRPSGITGTKLAACLLQRYILFDREILWNYKFEENEKFWIKYTESSFRGNNCVVHKKAHWKQTTKRYFKLIFSLSCNISCAPKI
jgi:hypothetical protein